MIKNNTFYLWSLISFRQFEILHYEFTSAQEFFYSIHRFEKCFTPPNIDCMHFYKGNIRYLDHTGTDSSVFSPTSAWQTHAVGSLKALMAGQSC